VKKDTFKAADGEMVMIGGERDFFGRPLLASEVQNQNLYVRLLRMSSI